VCGWPLSRVHDKVLDACTEGAPGQGDDVGFRQCLGSSTGLALVWGACRHRRRRRKRRGTRALDKEQCLPGQRPFALGARPAQLQHSARLILVTLNLTASTLAQDHACTGAVAGGRVIWDRGLATWSDGEAAEVDRPADAIPLSRRCVSRTATAVGRQLIHGGDTDREARNGPACELRMVWTELAPSAHARRSPPLAAIGMLSKLTAFTLYYSFSMNPGPKFVAMHG
jgi:hypothetical protein